LDAIPAKIASFPLSPGPRLSFGTVGRLAAAGAGFAAAHLTGDATVGYALANMAAGFLVNRATAVEDQFQEQIRASKNHHLQLALAGAFRIAFARSPAGHPSISPKGISTGIPESFRESPLAQ
jgi:hypothetical protein